MINVISCLKVKSFENPVNFDNGKTGPILLQSISGVTCPLPKIPNVIYSMPEDVIFSKTEALYGDSIHVTCEEGYTRNGPNKLTCTKERIFKEIEDVQPSCK